jgi:hypothetical protein
MKALLHHFSSLIIRKNLFRSFGYDSCKSRYPTFYNMLADPTMKITTLPLNFDVYHALQYLVHSPDNNR